MDNAVLEDSIEVEENRARGRADRESDLELIDTNTGGNSRQQGLQQPEVAVHLQHSRLVTDEHNLAPTRTHRQVLDAGNEHDMTSSSGWQEHGPRNTPASPKKKQKRGPHQGGLE